MTFLFGDRNHTMVPTSFNFVQCTCFLYS